MPGRSARKGRVFALEPLAGETHDAPRLPSGVPEVDRVTGGGFVRGSVLLMAGDPGIGKSTLLIQTAAALAQAGHRAVYISGEEAVAQVRLRAERLGLAKAPVELAAETSVEDIIATLSQGKTPRLIVVELDPDHVDRRGRIGARHGDAGARLGAGADPLRQALRRRGHPGRPCHQGRPDRRPARGRAHGRRGALVRGRRLAPVPHPARGEEPLRSDRRDRRVRDDRRRACARCRTRPNCSCPSAISAAPAPWCSPASRGRGRCWWKSRRWSPRPRSARRAAPWSAGTRAGSPWCSPCSRRIAA